MSSTLTELEPADDHGRAHVEMAQERGERFGLHLPGGARVSLPQWQEVLEKNRRNRDRFMAMEREKQRSRSTPNLTPRAR